MRCPKCNKYEMGQKHGRYGSYWACWGFPECDYKMNKAEYMRRRKATNSKINARKSQADLMQEFELKVMLMAKSKL